jgi:hypothetical protein
MNVIRISIGGLVLEAELFDTDTARAVYDALPVETGFNTWGDEFYFEIPVSMDLDDTATTDVRVGDIGFWPPGNALAIFFGPTLMSKGEEPVPASEVNVVGKIKVDAAVLKSVKSADAIIIEKAE